VIEEGYLKNEKTCSWGFIALLCFLPVCAILTIHVLAWIFSVRNQVLVSVLSLVFSLVILGSVVFSLRAHVQQYHFSKTKITLHVVAGFMLGMLPLSCLKFLVSLRPDRAFLSPMSLDTSVQTLVFIIGFCFVPILEELFIRGILYSIIRRKNVGVFWAAVIASVSFSIAHWNEASARKIMFFIFSMVLCFFYEKTRSLVFTLSIHVGSNVAAFLL
jgi:membrane protease YdiL (CAAX protease family)